MTGGMVGPRALGESWLQRSIALFSELPYIEAGHCRLFWAPWMLLQRGHPRQTNRAPYLGGKCANLNEDV